MKFLSKSWKGILALLLVMAAIGTYYLKYLPDQAAYESEKAALENSMAVLRAQITENNKYSEYQDAIPGALEEIEESRTELYERFPVKMLEEDQIMYVIYLEQIFGTEISFSLSSPYVMQMFSDGATLQGLELTVNYETSYEGFQDMINYLASDSRITSIKEASIEYDADNDVAKGYITLICYILDSENKLYESPDVKEPETGKDNIFD